MEVARENIERYDLQSRLKVIKGDLLTPLIKLNKSNVDIIVTNPPYISDCEMKHLPLEVKKKNHSWLWLVVPKD